MTDPIEIRVATMSDAAAIAPYLLGYHPQQSLIVLGMDQHRIAAAVATPLAPDFAAAAASVATVMADRNIATVLLIGYGSAAAVTEAVDRTAEQLRDVGVRTLAAARVADDRIWHLRRGVDGRPDDGIAFDPSTTAAAAYATVAGLVALPDRQALEAQLAPVTGVERRRMSAAFARAFDHLEHVMTAALAERRPGEDPTEPLEQLLHTLLEDMRAAATQDRRLDDDRAALLLALLLMPGMRDLAARRIEGDDTDRRAFTDLTRRADAALVAAPATLLAVSALLGADGVLAGIALRRASQEVPGDLLIRALELALQAGLGPEAIRRTLGG